jgi:hypothetical protein
MTASVTDPCGRLELPHAEAWAAHATVEHWLRDAVDNTTIDEIRIERVSRILDRLEADGVFTSDELSLLCELCRDRLAASAVPTRDHSSLRAVIDAAETQRERCVQ